MPRDGALAVLAAHQNEWREMGVGALLLFGPVAHNEARPDSDVGIMVELSRPIGMFKLLGIQEYLEGLFGRKAGLTTTDGLQAYACFRTNLLILQRDVSLEGRGPVAPSQRRALDAPAGGQGGGRPPVWSRHAHPHLDTMKETK